jgi:hypothetical protein
MVDGVLMDGGADVLDWVLVIAACCLLVAGWLVVLLVGY